MQTIILHLISSIGYFGSENVITELAEGIKGKYLDTFDAEVGVINNLYNSHMEICEILNSLDLEHAIFNCRRKLDLKTIFLIRAYIKKHKVSIIHCHGYKANFYGLAATFFLKIKRVTTVHNWIRTDIKLRIYSAFDKFIMRSFEKIVVVSTQIKEEILSCGIPREKIIFINNGVNLNRFSTQTDLQSLRRVFGINGFDKVVGTVGRLAPEKGHTYLIKAFRKICLEFPEAKLLLVGDGPLKGSLQVDAKNLGIENRVIFTGNRREIPDLLNLMDIFVLPSKVEAMPMALLEAMAARRSIVATKVGEVPKIISHNKDGILVEPEDTDELSKAIIFLLKNKEAAAGLADNGYRKAMSFSAEKMAQEYLTKVYLT